MTPDEAKGIARLAFGRRLDKSGKLQVLHSIRVGMTHMWDYDEQVVGYLHDVVEDTDITLQQLIDAGMTKYQAEALDAVTRRVGETYQEFIDRIAASGTLAVRVKLNDLNDNLTREDGADPKWYASVSKRWEKAKAQLQPLVK